MGTTYFTALGLEKDCSMADVKKAYRTMAKTLHPDVNPAEALKFRLLTDAYNALSSSDEALRRLARGLTPRSFEAWRREYDEAYGIKSAARSSDADYLEDLIRDMERRRREARRQNVRPEDRPGHWSFAQGRRAGETLEDFLARKAAEDRARHDFYDSEARHGRTDSKWQGSKAQEDHQHKAEGKCGAHTSSGPCCRPAGHTPNGHMSKKVADTKRENAKARRNANKGSGLF